MTRHKATQTGLGTPSPLDRWINAMLRGLAMLVSHVARRFASRHPFSAAECDGSCEPMCEAYFVLDQHQDPTPAAVRSYTPRASVSARLSATITITITTIREALMRGTIAPAIVS